MGIDYLDVATLREDNFNAIHSSCRRRGDQTHGTVHSNDRFPAYSLRDSPTAFSSPTCNSARSPPRPFPSVPALHAGNSGWMCMPTIEEKFRSWSLFFWFVCRPCAQFPPYRDVLEDPLPRNCQIPKMRAENGRTTKRWSQPVVIEKLIRVSTAAHAA